MALITCKECGRTVSDAVTSCPHCGAKVDSDESRILEASKKSRKREFYRKIVVIGIIVAIIFFLVVPKIFLHGLFNWKSHFDVSFNDKYNQKVWDIDSKDGKRYEDVTIHMTYSSKEYGLVKFEKTIDAIYSSTCVTEKEIMEMIDKKLEDQGGLSETSIEKWLFRVEYITWGNITK